MANETNQIHGVDILVVEDSATQAAQLRFLLEQQGHTVRVAANGKLALVAVRERKPALVITDVVMPEMDGYELCATLKSDPALNGLPVVIVTSLSGLQDIAKSLECGADNFIRKPYEPKALLARIEYILLNLDLRKSSEVKMGMEIYMGGKKHYIASGREQIIDLLISTYEEAVHMNEELQAQQREIALSNRTLRVLYRIAAQFNRVTTEAEVCDQALQGVLELPDFRAGWVWLDDGDGHMRTIATSALPPAMQQPAAFEGDCRCLRMLRAGDLGHGGAVVDCDRLSNSGVAEAGGARAHASIPLTVGEQRLGIMNVVGNDKSVFSGEDLRLLEAVGSQAALAVQRAQLYQHLEDLVAQRTAALQAEVVERTRAEQKVANLNRIYAVLSGINTTIVRVHDRHELFREACRIAVELGRFRLAWIGLLESDGRRLRPVAWIAEDSGPLPPADAESTVAASVVDADTGLLGRAIRQRSFVSCNDIEASEEEVFPCDVLAHGCRSAAVFPLFEDRRLTGVLALYAADVGVFEDEMELALLEEMAGDISFALEYIGKGEQLDHLAYYDALTDLPNRTLIHDRLSQLLQARREGGEGALVALALINIERFKSINDTFGRHTGDTLLKLVAERLGVAFGGTDRLARIGSDHFAVIMAGLDDAADVAHLLDRAMLRGLGQPFAIEGKDLHLTFRFGIALYPSDGRDAETLFVNAETALRKAGVNEDRYLFYAPQMNAQVSEQLSLENRLHRALEKDEFVLHYQPKVSLKDGTVVGLEALIRWRDPDKGLISPAAFIPTLEETGMIVEVGRWALERALADAASWRAAGLPVPRVAVNVSAVQMRRKDFLNTLEQALASHPGESNYVDLELTESLLMEDIEVNIRKLGAIREMGIKVAIDDFGTGYSSLSYLKRFPIDQLKIDQSFVRDITADPDAASICVAIIGLAHNLRLSVIAEGVETGDQMTYLRRHDCDEMQGYLFSRPVPAADCTQMLTARRTLVLPSIGAIERRRVFSAPH
ncbi:diguanylate cyclase (GGDEF) domain-containing protein [Aromatoleum tolulyticum]|uniref:Diguanylate cyclase (GGDEF) domain-containing protein n=1 Tax=Aromatoleum tolulyticum TaxID=34027 RepID=A0A1N6N401_9RHOO|nr:EAL domain-containing protein [Aromatoleum tolulyticum]SIP86804.1 diguanylate cyclase (GGDEF) domain-containing protein [Aromatoleum tolulyticum]